MIADEETNTTRYHYDNKGNKTSEETADRYFIASIPHSRTLKLVYSYDERDRVDEITRSGNVDGDYLISGSQTFSYDLNSNLSAESDWKGVPTSHL